MLALIIVARAWRMTIVDNRRARTLRNLAASTGQLGELIVTRGSGKVRRGMRYAVLQEGMIGASRKADIRIHAAGVAKKHAHFRLQPDGLLLSSIDGASLRFADGDEERKLLVRDGDSVSIGGVTLLCVLFDGQTEQVHAQNAAPYVPPIDRYDEFDDRSMPMDPFDDIAEDPFMLNKEDIWQDPKPTRRRSKKR